MDYLYEKSIKILFLLEIENYHEKQNINENKITKVISSSVKKNGF